MDPGKDEKTLLGMQTFPFRQVVYKGERLMNSKILVIADASREALPLITDALYKIKEHQPSVRLIFISHLSDSFKTSFGPNILKILMKEEKETLERARDHFSRMDMRCSVKAITVPPWDGVFRELEEDDYDLVMIQGDFIKTWKKWAMPHVPMASKEQSSQFL